MHDRSKTREEVMRLAAHHGLEILADSLQFNESGLDFQVVLATDTEGERWVLRFPRREDVLLALDKEKRTLELVNAHLAVEAPRWVVATNELIAYKALKGVPAGMIDIAEKAYVWAIDATDVPSQFHQSLAEGMVSLHQISIEAAHAAGLPVEDAVETRAAMQRRMDAVRSEFPVSDEMWERWQRWLQNDALWPEQTALTHGDLHAGHILVDADAHVTGFIDWTEARVTDYSTDFVAHYHTFGRDALKKLIAAYSEAGGRVWSQMEEHIIELSAAYPVAIAEFALRSGLDEYREMTLQSLGN